MNITSLKLTVHNVISGYIDDDEEGVSGYDKTGCAASILGGDYLKGASIRQEYLETAIK